MERRSFLKIFAICTAVPFVFFKKAWALSGQKITDFGNIIARTSAGTIESTPIANQHLKKAPHSIHPRGYGHSCMGQSLKEGAWHFTPPSGPITLDGDSVTAFAGTSIFEIDAFLEDKGLMLPVSPDHRVLSLGGCLSVGGYGVESCRAGSLTDHVRSLDLLLPDGKRKTVLPEDDLFSSVLHGLGRHGIILSAKMNVVPKPDVSRLYEREFRSLESYLRFVEELEAENIVFDYWYAGKYKDSITLRVGFQSNTVSLAQGLAKHFTVRHYNDLRAMRKEQTDNWVFKAGNKYRVWSDHIATLSRLGPQLKQADALAKALERLGADVAIYSCKIRPSLIVSAPHYFNEPCVFSVGLYANFQEHMESEAKAAGDQMIAYSETSIKEGAKPYRYGWYHAEIS